jgi:hypothetical protein
MGLFGGKRYQESGSRSKPAETPAPKGGSDDTRSRLAFVLLEQAIMPDPTKIAEAFAFYAAPGQQITEERDEDEEKETPSVYCFAGPGNARLMAMLIPMPIPNGEAEENVRFSLSSFTGGWKLPPYTAHVMVTMMVGEGSPIDTMSVFTAFIAALTATSSAVGVYWGNAGATHSRDFVLTVAEEKENAPRLALWSGISIAREKDGRLSLLSLGMRQLGMPDLLLTPKSGMPPGDAIMTVYDLLAYTLSFGQPIPAGNTVGRTADERIPVRYVPSPRDRSVKVMHVDGL